MDEIDTTPCTPYLFAKSLGGLGCPRQLSRLGHAERGRNAGVGAGHGVGSEADRAYAVLLHGPEVPGWFRVVWEKRFGVGGREL